MKILHIAISRGWHAQVANAFLAIKHQDTIGHAIHVVTLKNSTLQNNIKNCKFSGIVHTIKNHDSPYLPILLFKIIKKNDYDAIHIHGTNGKFALLVALIMSGKKISVVCSVRDKLSEHDKMFHFSWRHISSIIVPNDLVKRRMGSGFLGRNNVVIIPPPVDSGHFKPNSGRMNEQVTVGMFARFDVVKDYPVFFRACAIVRSHIPDFRIVVAGKNFEAHCHVLDSMLVDHGLRDITQVLANPVDVAEEISRIDIGVVASNGSEELSRVALEYMACSVAVVATDVGCLPELITEDVGILVPHGAPDRLADAMMVLMRDAEKREFLGRNGRKMIEKNHAVELYCDNLHKCYAKNFL
jgi:glycosyltransferase involved in cell wall biosynthesis